MHCIALFMPPSGIGEFVPFDFFCLYEVIRMTSNTEDELLQFHNGFFQHSSYRSDKHRFLQGVRPRKTAYLIKVLQYDFPDTAEFGGSLHDTSHTITDCMETYCQQVLLLFHPLRQLTDITLQGSYTLRFREAVRNGILIGENARNFLQNIQDAKSNSFRVSRLEDDLQRATEPYKGNDDVCDVFRR